MGIYVDKRGGADGTHNVICAAVMKVKCLKRVQLAITQLVNLRTTLVF